jgi:DegV family protein with EDD domain
MTVKLVTDSTSYIDSALQKQLDLTVIPLSINFPDESFKETEVSPDYFYSKLNKSEVIPTSSQPSQGDIYTAFKEIIIQGHDVLGIFLSSDMSGTYHTALSAKEMLLQEYPEARIEVLDSRSNCMALGLPVIEAAKASQAGQPLEEVTLLARQIIARMHFYFIPATLEYLKKGGRIGGAAALIGSILNIKPILYVHKGKTDLLERARGSRAAIERLYSLLDQAYQTHGLKEIVVQHINDLNKAREVAQTISLRYGKEVQIMPIGPVIGLHVGPGTIGIVFCTEKITHDLSE